MAQTTPQYVRNTHLLSSNSILDLLKLKVKMGIKGDKLTQDSSITAELIVEKLNTLEGITAKKMFGGHGIFHEGKMFGIIDSKGHAFLKVDESNKLEYEKLRAQQHSKMPYFSIPEEVINDQDMFLDWAQKSISISKS